MEGDDRGSAPEDRPPAPALHRRRPARLRADLQAAVSSTAIRSASTGRHSSVGEGGCPDLRQRIGLGNPGGTPMRRHERIAQAASGRSGRGSTGPRHLRALSASPAPLAPPARSAPGRRGPSASPAARRRQAAPPAPGRRGAAAASAAASRAGSLSPSMNSGIASSSRIRFGSTIDLALQHELERPHDRVGAIGDHRRHAGERELQRHRAGGGERRMRPAEGRELLRLALDDRRLHRPVGDARPDLVDKPRHRGQHAPPAARPPPRRAAPFRRTAPSGGRPRSAGCPAAPAAPAARRSPRAARSPARGRKSAEPCDQRVADIGAGRPADAGGGLPARRAGWRARDRRSAPSARARNCQ